MIDKQSQEVQCHLPTGSLSVTNVRVSVVVSWKSRTFQDKWNRLSGVPAPAAAPARSHRLLSVRLRGTPDQERLTALREALGMTKRGRLTDREDAELGGRQVGDARLVLWRQDDDCWEVSLHARSDHGPDPAVLSRLVAEVWAAAPAAGLTVEREERRSIP